MASMHLFRFWSRSQILYLGWCRVLCHQHILEYIDIWILVTRITDTFLLQKFWVEMNAGKRFCKVVAPLYLSELTPSPPDPCTSYRLPHHWTIEVWSRMIINGINYINVVEWFQDDCIQFLSRARSIDQNAMLPTDKLSLDVLIEMLTVFIDGYNWKE